MDGWTDGLQKESFLFCRTSAGFLALVVSDLMELVQHTSVLLSSGCSLSVRQSVGRRHNPVARSKMSSAGHKQRVPPLPPGSVPVPASVCLGRPESPEAAQ